MVKEVRLNSTGQQRVRIMNATQRETGQLRDLEAFVFCPEELVRLPGAVAAHDLKGVGTRGRELCHIGPWCSI